MAGVAARRGWMTSSTKIRKFSELANFNGNGKHEKPKENENPKLDALGGPEHRFSLLQREIEKLRFDIEKDYLNERLNSLNFEKTIFKECSDLRCYFETSILEETGLLHEKISEDFAKAFDIFHKHDRDIQATIARIEDLKYYALKCAAFSVVAASAAVVAIYKLFP